MSQHPLTRTTARRRRRAFVILCTFLVAVAFAGWVAWPSKRAAAADPTVPPPLTDVMLARAALVALDAEPDLRGVNLVVSVVDRIAVIGGPVATPRQAKRAEEVVRAVAGIEGVKNTCFVTPLPDPLLKAVADRLGSTLPERPVMTDLPGVWTGVVPPVSPFAPNGGTDPNRVVARPGPGTVVALRPSLPGITGILGAPVGAAGSAATPTPPPLPNTAPGVLTGTLPPTTPVRPSDVLTAANEARKSDPRFARLTVEARDGVLVIGGSAPLVSDAWDFAEKLRAIPGVTRVAVGAVSGK